MLFERLAHAELHGKIRGNDQVSQIVWVREVIWLYVGRVRRVPRPEADGAATLGMQKARNYTKSVLERYLVVSRLLQLREKSIQHS